MNLRTAGVWAFAAFFLLLCGAALGDGKMFSNATAFVEMPEQSAVVAFDGQVQQLVISTAFDGPEGEYAWVVPLPAVPEVGRVSEGVLPTLNSLSRPRIVTHTRFWMIFAWVGVCLWAAVLVRRSHLLVVLFLIGMIAAPSLLPHLFLGEPTLSGTIRGMEDGAGVTVHQRLRVGEYDVATLTAESAQDLLVWLAENGFQVSDGVGPVLSDYIRDGWCFTAYRFHPESGAERSHPLSFTFSTDRAVYPLRLTAVDSDGLDLALYVFGNEEATAKGLARRRCGFLRIGDEISRDRSNVGSIANYRSEMAQYDHNIYVVHEGVEEIAKPYRVMTTLAGHLTPEQMALDLYLEWRRPRPYRVVVYSPEAAESESRWRGAVAFLAATVLGVAWVGWKTYARRSVRIHVA